MPVFLLAFALFAEAIAMSGRHSLQFVAMNLNRSNHSHDSELVKRELIRYVQQFGEIPASLDDLATTPGYESVRSATLNNRFAYEAIYSINDGNYRFDRAIFATTSSAYPVAADALSDNKCGSGLTDAYWCNDQANGVVVDTRQSILNKQLLNAVQLNELYYRLASLVTYTLDVPRERSNGSTLGAGSAGSLASYVGYAGTSDSCSGAFSFHGVALTCRDLFDTEGEPIYYNYLGNRGFAVVSTLNEHRANGEMITIYKAAFL